LYAGGYQTGLIGVEMYGVYQTANAQPAEVTLAWKEAGQVKTHAEKVPPAAKEYQIKVPTGAAIVDEYIRVRMP
jgi:hypothetical protein